MSASATSAKAGLCLGWRTSILTQEPLRPALQDREEGTFSQLVKSNGGQPCARLCFNYWGFIHSFIEFHCKALNKTDIFPALKDHTGSYGRQLEKITSKQIRNRNKVSC